MHCLCLCVTLVWHASGGSKLRGVVVRTGTCWACSSPILVVRLPWWFQACCSWAAAPGQQMSLLDRLSVGYRQLRTDLASRAARLGLLVSYSMHFRAIITHGPLSSRQLRVRYAAPRGHIVFYMFLDINCSQCRLASRALSN